MALLIIWGVARLIVEIAKREGGREKQDNTSLSSYLPILCPKSRIIRSWSSPLHVGGKNP
jgi:hypothetical protein